MPGEGRPRAAAGGLDDVLLADEDERGRRRSERRLFSSSAAADPDLELGLELRFLLLVPFVLFLLLGRFPEQRLGQARKLLPENQLGASPRTGRGSPRPRCFQGVPGGGGGCPAGASRRERK